MIFAFFYKNVLFLISILKVYRIILTHEYSVLLLLPKYVCFVTFYLNMWAWRHRKNTYFNALPSTYGLTAVIYGFAAVYGFIAVTCNLWLLLGTRIGPNWYGLSARQVGVRACPPRRQGKALQRHNFPEKTFLCTYWWSSMLDVEFYRLYNGLWAFDFRKSLPSFLPFLPWFSTVPGKHLCLDATPNSIINQSMRIAPVRYMVFTYWLVY